MFRQQYSPAISILKSCLQSLSLCLISRLAEEGEHILLVCLYAWLVERIHAEHVTADTAGFSKK